MFFQSPTELEDNVPNPFEELSSEHVLQKVSGRLTSEKTGSLWRALESELKESGVAGADTYLGSVFSDVSQGIKQALDHFKESAKAGG